ncbi:DUF397 domain-containing protein [Streptomyces monomycini]|uniref:DUF397 domain-containing protein n=1 Tax=Streptomyces monomycini TaxID=371720 RepID=UPI0004AB965E|nr:DUF397 domain-containing protein [Streptomyces monomycini]
MGDASWTKSSYSDAGGNNCVEVRSTWPVLALREGNSPKQVMTLARSALRALLVDVKAGAFDKE